LNACARQPSITVRRYQSGPKIRAADDPLVQVRWTCDCRLGTLGGMLLEIHGHHLPGRHWHLDGEPYDNVHVGVQVRREPHNLVRGDAASATWTVPIDVVERDGKHDFRGPAVQGRRDERFVYLTWGNVGADGTFTMFRRAKLMLADLLELADEPHVIAGVHLTDDCGGPRCARLRPPALTLTHGSVVPS
jgi:Family of unknown function (DUF5990)